MASVRKRANASPLQHAVQVSRMRFKSDRQGQRSYRGCHLLFLTGAAYQQIGKWVLAGAVLVGELPESPLPCRRSCWRRCSVIINSMNRSCPRKKKGASGRWLWRGCRFRPSAPDLGACLMCSVSKLTHVRIWMRRSGRAHFRTSHFQLIPFQGRRRDRGSRGQPLALSAWLLHRR